MQNLIINKKKHVYNFHFNKIEINRILKENEL